MTLKETVDKIEEILQNEIKTSKDNWSNTAKELLLLISHFVIRLFKIPLRFIEKGVKKKLIAMIKKDAKMYVLITGIFMFIFVIFFVLWVSIAMAIGVYFREQGNSYFVAIMYSILFQILTIPVIWKIAYISFKNLQSVKMMKEIKIIVKEKVIKK